MKFKKIYLEITNVCNLSCDFCIKNSRLRNIMDINFFSAVLDKLNGFTEYLYFHILKEQEFSCSSNFYSPICHFKIG